MNIRMIKNSANLRKYIEIIEEGIYHVKVRNTYLDSPYNIWTWKGLTLAMDKLVYTDNRCEKLGITGEAIKRNLLDLLAWDDLCTMGLIVIYYGDKDDKDMRRFVRLNPESESAFLSFIYSNQPVDYNAEKNIIFLNIERIQSAAARLDCDKSPIDQITYCLLMAIYIQDRTYNFIARNPIYCYDMDISEELESYNSLMFAESVSRIFKNNFYKEPQIALDA